MQKWFFTLCTIALICLSSCQTNQVKTDERIQEFFKTYNVEGSFIWMNNSKGEFIVSDLKRDTARVLAGESIAIPFALIGLENSIIKNAEMPFDQQLDLSNWLAHPISHSTSIVANLIGQEMITQYLDSLHYGNANQSSLWKEVAISSDEQLGLIKKVYFKQLQISNRSMQILAKSVPSFTLKNNITMKVFSSSGKDDSPFWQIGWVEDGTNAYFFAGHLQRQNTIIDKKIGSELFGAIITVLLNKP